MKELSAEEELALVQIALRSGLSNCVDWYNDALKNRIRADRQLRGLTPKAIRAELLRWAKAGGTVAQVVERRAEYADHFRFYYKAILWKGDADFPNGVFVEMRLTDPDEECPVVTLVNAHCNRM